MELDFQTVPLPQQQSAKNQSSVDYIQAALWSHQCNHISLHAFVYFCRDSPVIRKYKASYNGKSSCSTSLKLFSAQFIYSSFDDVKCHCMLNLLVRNTECGSLNYCPGYINEKHDYFFSPNRSLGENILIKKIYHIKSSYALEESNLLGQRNKLLLKG